MYILDKSVTLRLRAPCETVQIFVPDPPIHFSTCKTIPPRFSPFPLETVLTRRQIGDAMGGSQDVAFVDDRAAAAELGIRATGIVSDQSHPGELVHGCAITTHDPVGADRTALVMVEKMQVPVVRHIRRL